MKTIAVRILSVLFCELSFLVSCSKDTGRTISSEIRQEITIKTEDFLIINLGIFGDEEVAWILKDALNARVSKVYRAAFSGSVFYDYLPIDKFVGIDSVIIILNRGSDGAGPGINDTTKIRINVKR